eukprot:NODE_71_length_24927_cov_1.205937.p11 type:complete len:328 gc:universal NODE_71_length_24927_cov_1.205937:9003-9986(+)
MKKKKTNSFSYWNEVLNYPFHSKLGYAIFTLNTIVIIISMINVLLSTMWSYIDSEAARDKFVIIDLLTNVYFIFEWIIRVYTSKNKTKLLKSKIVWLEGLSNLVIIADIEFLISSRNDWIITGWVPLLCTIRCFRLCRLYWHSFQLQLAWKAVRQARDGLIMMIVLSCISLLFLANILYFAEELSCETRNNVRYYISGPEVGKPCAFQSLFDAYWFTVCSITTTGYGDIVPKTAQGKTIAAFVMLLAVVMFTFPITIISAHLTEIYMREKQRRRFKKNNVIDPSLSTKNVCKTLISKCENDIELITKQLVQLQSILSQVSKNTDLSD